MRTLKSFDFCGTRGRDRLDLSVSKDFHDHAGRDIYAVCYFEHMADEETPNSFHACNNELFFNRLLAELAYSLRSVSETPSRTSGIPNGFKSGKETFVWHNNYLMGAGLLSSEKNLIPGYCFQPDSARPVAMFSTGCPEDESRVVLSTVRFRDGKWECWAEGAGRWVSDVVFPEPAMWCELTATDQFSDIAIPEDPEPVFLHKCQTCGEIMDVCVCGGTRS